MHVVTVAGCSGGRLLQVLLGTVVEGLLSAEPPKLQGIREGLEGLFMHPRAAAAARCLRTALPSLERMHPSSVPLAPGVQECLRGLWGSPYSSPAGAIEHVVQPCHPSTQVHLIPGGVIGTPASQWYHGLAP